MADGITLDKVNVEIESNSSKAATSIDKLVESIKRLQSATSSGTGELSKLNTTIKGIVDNINNSFNNIGNINTENVRRNISNSINKIDKSFTGMSSKTLKNKFNIKPEFDFESFKDDTDLLQKYGEKTKILSKNGEVVSVTLKKVQDGIETVTTASKKGITQTEKYVKEQSKLNNVLKAFSGIGILGIIKRLWTGIGKYTDMSSQYISNMNYFNTTMGTMKDTATDFVNTMEKNFYLDPSNLMNYMASFNSLIKGFGIAEEQSYKMSKNLTQLSYDLAAFKGISIEDAMQKIKSGISGELEPMRAIGVALDQATLQETAYDLGIKKRVNTMTRAQKTELLYYQMMKSTAEAQNYFASTLAKTVNQLDGSTKLILNPASALSLLKQQFSQLGRAIGNIFIPILTKMIPYIMAATQVMRDLANAVASLLGFKIEDFSFAGSLKDTSKQIAGVGTNADKTAKKVKGMLAPFDELNTIDFGDKGGSGDDALGGGSLGIPVEGYKWEKNEALTETIESIKRKMQMLLPLVVAVGTAFTGWKIGSGVVGLLKTLGVISSKGKAAALTKVLKFAGGIGAVIGGVVGLFSSLKSVLEDNTFHWERLATALGSVALIAGGIFLMFGGVPALVAAIVGAIAVAGTYIYKYWDEIKAWAQGVWESIKGFISPIADWINEKIIKPVSGFFKKMWEDISAPLGPLFEEITGTFKMAWEVIKLVWDKVAPFFKLLGETIKLAFQHAWENIKERWNAVAPYFQAIWEAIKAVFSVVGSVLGGFFSTAWEVIKAVWNVAVSYFTVVWAGIKAVFAVVKGVLSGDFSEAWAAIKNVWDRVKQYFQSVWDGIKSVFGSVATWFGDVFKKAWEAVKKVFSAGGKIFDGIKEGIASTLKTVVNGIIKGMNKVISIPFNNLNTVLRKIKEISIAGVKPFNWVSTISVPQIPTFAEGGFPEVGDLFIANEAGPEWISTMGGKTAVANQDQMTTGIRQAAYEGISQALRENPQSHKTEVNIGNRRVYEGYGSYQTRQANKYGVSTVTV